jgi:hypothetical protein
MANDMNAAGDWSIYSAVRLSMVFASGDIISPFYPAG